jgi:hypothetical protein
MMTTVWDKLKGPRLTGIGSLPHSNIDSALEYSMRVGIPYLPQIPIRNPWEYMIPQALDGLPGAQWETGGLASLPLDVWKSQSHSLDRRLERAFSSEVFDDFEPSGSTSSGWQPFLWELEERGHSIAKIQIAGPFTCQWAIQFKGELPGDYFSEISSQIYRLVLARSLAMVKRLASAKIHPIIYIDEPGLYAYSKQNPKHLTAIQELKLMVQSLKKLGATVGIHCCGNTDWSALVETGIDILSLDTSLSLKTALSEAHRPSIESWLKNGGRFSLGVIPTPSQVVERSQLIDRPLDLPWVKTRVDHLVQTLNQSWIGPAGWTSSILSQGFFTPSCGLALQSISDAEWSLESLVSFYETLYRS